MYYMSVRTHISETTRPNFANFSMLPMAADRSSSGGIAIRYVGLTTPFCRLSFFHMNRRDA